MPQDKRIARWLAQLARLYTGEQRRLTAEYRSIVSRLEPERLQLTASMERLERAGNLTPQNVRDLAAYGRLLARTADELNGYGRVLESSLARISDGSIQLGTEAAWNLSAEMAGRLGEVVRTAYRQPDTDAIRQLVRYVDSDAMRANLAKFGQAGADNLADVLLAGLGSGQGAGAVARLLTNWYAVPLAWSENMTRTLGNWSYRMASHASYRLNSDIVTGWIWSASLDARCCLSCISMHGTRHTHDEVLNDHHRGRCLVPGELVTTLRGDVPVEAVQVGDVVYTHAGRWQRVVRLYEREYAGDVVTICSGDHAVTVTPEHPVLTQRGWVEASDLSASDTFLTLVSSDVRESRCSTVQPSAVSRRSLRLSTGRLIGERYTGKVYDLEVETDHSFFAGGIAVHNCAAIPIVRGGLVADSIGTGEAWFDGLSDAQKREIMGPGRYDLYTSGRWDWRAVSKPYNDPVYGEMLRAATLTEMRGR